MLIRPLSQAIAAVVVLLAPVAGILAAQENASPTAPPDALGKNHALLRKAIAKIEPSGAGAPERLAVYVAYFQRELVNDNRLFAIDIDARMENDVLILSGYVEFEETLRLLLAYFRMLGFETIDDRVELLPSDDLGAARFGFVKSTHAICYDQPDGEQENVTDCLLGEPLFLLKETPNGFFLCHAGEGYLGYIDGDDVLRVEADDFGAYQSGPRIRVTADVALEGELRLPVGARLRFIQRDDDHVVAALPNGEEVSLPADKCEVVYHGAHDRIERILDHGHGLLGTKYLWGGKSSAGIDCSGLVQVAFLSEGLNLPRDSNQQVYLGRLTATRWWRDGMRRGDTLYFLGGHGKIVHTGIYLGDGEYLESAGRGVKVSSFRAGDPHYVASRARSFAFAKRLLE